MMRCWFYTLLALASVAVASAQDSVYTVEVVGVGGVQITKYNEPPTEQSTTDVFTGSAFLGRVLWRPDHLLAVGLQSGYQTFSEEVFKTPGSQGTVDLGARLTGIPVQLVLSMHPGDFDVGVGLGLYVLQAVWRADDVQRVSSSATEFGVHMWVGYDVQLLDRLSVGPELSLHVLSNRGVAALNAGLRVRFDVIRY